MVYMKLLVVCYDFPPVNRSASLRPYGLAKYWARAGVDVKILTTSLERPGIPVNPRSIYNDLDRFEVIEIPPQPWVRAKSLQAPPTEASAAASPGCSLKAAVKRALSSAGMGSFASPPEWWIRPSVREMLRLHRRWPFEVVFSTYGPAACHIIAAKVRQRVPFFWVADYRDYWSDGDLNRIRWPFSVLERRREDRATSICNMITTISEPFGETYRRRFPGKPLEVIENGFDPEELNTGAADHTDLPRIDSNPQEKHAIVYCGNLSLEHRDPSPLVEALAALRDSEPILIEKLEFVIYTTDHQLTDRLIAKHRVQGLVRNGGYLPRTEILGIQRRAAALVFLDWENHAVEGVLTGKLFEYLASGTPILSVGGKAHSSANQIIAGGGFGVAVGHDRRATLQALRSIASGNGLTYAPDPSVLQRFDRKVQAEKLLDAIRRGQPSPSVDFDECAT